MTPKNKMKLTKEQIKEVYRAFRAVKHMDDWNVPCVYWSMLADELRDPGCYARAEKKRIARLRKIVAERKRNDASI